MRDIHPCSSRLRNERSTFWATSLLRKLVDNDIWSHSSVNAIVERSLPLQFVLFLAMSMRVINPFVSHMPMACFFDWAATHATVVQRSYLCQREVFDSHVSRTVFPSTSLWGKIWRFGAPIVFSLSTTVSDASHRLFDVLINVFFWSNKTASCSVCFPDFRSFLKIWRCGASIPVPLACETSALPFELHPRWGYL